MMERNEGIIINMSGGGSDTPLPGGSGYACSKVALMRLTDVLANELERIGSSILVFGMRPGGVRTKMMEHVIQTPEGQRWMPSTKEYFDEKRDRPSEDCAKAMVELIRIACRELSGRVFGVGMDFTEIAKRVSEIRQKDLFVIRFRT
jgi:NAD(P)-dependent dehydrogenase (short-subunit alcohol dehydrogenase family)